MKAKARDPALVWKDLHGIRFEAEDPHGSVYLCYPKGKKWVAKAYTYFGDYGFPCKTLEEAKAALEELAVQTEAKYRNPPGSDCI
jgi:hypothetical protein